MYCSIVIGIEVWFGFTIFSIIVELLEPETMNKIKSVIAGVGAMMWGLLQL